MYCISGGRLTGLIRNISECPGYFYFESEDGHGCIVGLGYRLLGVRS